MLLFDRKFGEQLISDLPTTAGVYLFKNELDTVIYVGKAKNIRRRLQQYRSASRRKIHRKMRRLVREASSVEIRLMPSEREALVAENQLILDLRPVHNVDGTYEFLYPTIGLGGDKRQALLCFTTHVEAWADLNLRWYGVFRSRLRSQEAFRALVYLLSLVGHIERAAHLPDHERLPGSRLTGFRRLSVPVVESLHRYLGGDEQDVLIPLASELLEKPRARRDSKDVQASLKVLTAFHKRDLIPLKQVLKISAEPGSFVPQNSRDALFLASDTSLEG